MQEAFREGLKAGQAYLDELIREEHPFVVLVKAVDLACLTYSHEKEGEE